MTINTFCKIMKVTRVNKNSIKLFKADVLELMPISDRPDKFFDWLSSFIAWKEIKSE